MKRKKSLKTTLVGVCVALAALICAVVGAIGIFAVRSITNVAYDKYETAMDEGYNAEIKSQVQSVLAILQMEYDKVLAGDMSETEAQEEASEIVRAMRYRDDESGYFWIDDTDYVLVMHPILAEQEGSNRYDLEDQNGVMIIQEIMNSCLSEDAGGFNEFYFTKADGVTVAPKIAYSGFFEPWGWAISTGNYVDDMKLDMQEVNNSIKKDFYTACAIMAGCCAVLIALAAVISFIFGEIVVIPLRKMQSFAEKLSEGNLTEDVEVKQKNEIGVTAEKLNMARRQINSLVKAITSIAQEIDAGICDFELAFSQMGDSIRDVDTAVEGISQNITKQAGSTMEASAEVNAIAEEIDHTSKEVTDLNNNSDAMKRLSQECFDKLNKLVQANEKTREDVRSMHAQAEATNDAAESIKKATELIEEISTQTNLLSLNASIEAARAGESGKGFAVVAAEIGGLANQSANATEEITHIIDNLRENSLKSLSVMDKMNATIEEQVKALGETENNFNSLYTQLDSHVGSIVNIKNMTQEIDERRLGIMEVLNTLTSLAEDNAASSEETSAMAEELSQTVSRSIDTVADLKKEIEELMQDVKKFSV